MMADADNPRLVGYAVPQSGSRAVVTTVFALQLGGIARHSNVRISHATSVSPLMITVAMGHLLEVAERGQSARARRTQPRVIFALVSRPSLRTMSLSCSWAPPSLRDRAGGRHRRARQLLGARTAKEPTLAVPVAQLAAGIPGSYMSQDASRPWLILWTLQGSSVLGVAMDENTKQRCVIRFYI